MAEEKNVTIIVTADFKFAYRGCEVVEYFKGQTVDVSQECADIARREKWAKATKTKAAQQVDDDQSGDQSVAESDS